MKKDRWQRRNDVTREQRELAFGRTAFLFGVMHSYNELSLRSVIASAYLQGIEDAADAMTARPLQASDPTNAGGGI